MCVDNFSVAVAKEIVTRDEYFFECPKNKFSHFVTEDSVNSFKTPL
jgi:hypothetical protein